MSSWAESEGYAELPRHLEKEKGHTAGVQVVSTQEEGMEGDRIMKE